MTSRNGSIAGMEKIVDHGPNTSRYNLVILGDGYQNAELPKYAADVAAFIAKFQNTPPYNVLWNGINVFRVDVVSNDSLAAGPGAGGPPPQTYFDSTFGAEGALSRLLTCDEDAAFETANNQVPEVLMVLLIVNTPQYGGSGGKVAVFSTAESASEIGLHEMGHTAFGFADEYACYQGCGSGETGHDRYVFGEPAEPNVTAINAEDHLKWRALLSQPGGPFPTTANGDCGDCDKQINPQAATYVGLYEGGRYFHCGCYRPSFDCRMRTLGVDFCAVCQAVITAKLQPYLVD